MARNTLLVTQRFGSMVQLAAVLTDAEPEADRVIADDPCPPDCRLCLDICPQGALDGKTVDQARCRPLSNFLHEKAYRLKRCNRCRSVCPNVTGWRR